MAQIESFKNETKKTSKRIPKNKTLMSSGFTLIELMVAMAIIALLAGVLLVGMAGYGKDAREAKALAVISSVIPSMVSCWGNGSSPTAPSGKITSSMQICNSSPSYGYWPQSQGDLKDYWYGWTSTGTTDRNSWAFGFYNAGDDIGVCCNSAMKGCQLMKWTGWSCSETSPTN